MTITEAELEALRRKQARRIANQKGANFELVIMQLAMTQGWRCAKFDKMKDPRTGKWRTPVSADGAGFPDVVAARAGRVLFIELKAGGSLSKEQRAWRDAIRPAEGAVALPGAPEWHLWTPDDLEVAKAVLAKHPPRLT